MSVYYDLKEWGPNIRSLVIPDGGGFANSYLIKIEAAILQGLKSYSALSTQQLADITFQTLFAQPGPTRIPNYAFVSIQAALLDLAHRKQVCLNDDRNWSLVP